MTACLPFLFSMFVLNADAAGADSVGPSVVGEPGSESAPAVPSSDSPALGSMVDSSNAPAEDKRGNGLEDVFAFVSSEENDVMITTGTRVAVKLGESPSSVWVIDRKMIESSAANSIVELLRMIPGVAPLEITAGETAVSLRSFTGFPVNKVLYLIDGRSVLLDYLGQTDVHALNVDVRDLERIEVVLGPASTLYGANAYNGVVNLITRAPLHREGFDATGFLRAGGGLGGSGVVGQPAYNTFGFLGHGFASFRQGFDKFAYKLTFAAEQLPNYARDPTGANIRGATDPVSQRRLLGTADGSYKDGSLSMRLSLSAGAKSGRFLTFDAGLTDSQDYAAFFQLNKGDLFADGDNLSVSAWGRRVQTNYVLVVSPAPPLSFAFPLTSGELLLQYTSARFYRNRLIAGFQGRVFSADWALVQPNGRFQQIYGLFVEDEFRPWKQLILTAGARLETREASAFRPLSRLTVSPRFAVVVVPHEQHTLRVEYSTAYRNPTPLENFAQVYVFNGAVEALRGNSQVRPEQQQQIALSYQGRVSWLQPRAEVAYGYSRDTIEIRDIVVGNPLPQGYANRNNYEYVSATAQLEANPWKELKLTSFYNLFLDRDLPVKTQKGGTPAHMIGLNAWFDFGFLHGSLQTYFQGQYQQTPIGVVRYEMPARLVINAQVGAFLDAKHRFELIAAGLNLADARFYVSQPGASLARVYRDAPAPGVERAGLRFWLGFNFHYDGLAQAEPSRWDTL